jgi:manganese transport protein
MEGFLRLRLSPWARRLLTRGVAVLPVLAVTAWAGEGATGKLLVLSQVVLSMQLPFAVIPLVQFVSSRRIMGDLAVSRGWSFVAWVVALGIVILNVRLLVTVFLGGEG